MIIGFNNGVFLRAKILENTEFNPVLFNHLRAGEANAIELHCNEEAKIDLLIDNVKLTPSGFLYLSMHMFFSGQADEEKISRVADKMAKLKEKFDIKNFVFHTDKIIPWKILAKYDKIPISVENMDDRKLSGRTVKDIESILDKYPFGLTLDLQHCFVNDPTMKLAADFQETFKDRIVEYHISGFNPEHNHYPLYKTKQDIIIDSIKYKNIPIIIESNFDEIGEQKKELEYIKAKLID